MKATGIVRRIDELGRIVIPKEIRRTLRIRENDPLEIFTAADGEIILKKYSPIAELTGFAEEYVQALNGIFGHSAVIFDLERVVAVAGNVKRQLTERRVSQIFESWLFAKRPLNTYENPGAAIPLTREQEAVFQNQIAAPIVVNGDTVGAVALIGDEGAVMGEREVDALKVAALYLAKQLDT